MICKWIKNLFSKKEKSRELEWLENKVKDSEDKLERIENEEVDINDVNDHFNK